MSLTFSHTVTRSGAAATAFGTCSASASATVEPDTATFVKRLLGGSASRENTTGHAWVAGSLVPTPTESLAPTAT